MIQSDEEIRYTWTYNGTDNMLLTSNSVPLTIAAHSMFYPQLLEIANPGDKTIPRLTG